MSRQQELSTFCHLQQVASILSKPVLNIVRSLLCYIFLISLISLTCQILPRCFPSTKVSCHYQRGRMHLSNPQVLEVQQPVTWGVGAELNWTWLVTRLDISKSYLLQHLYYTKFCSLAKCLEYKHQWINCIASLPIRHQQNPGAQLCPAEDPGLQLPHMSRKTPTDSCEDPFGKQPLRIFRVRWKKNRYIFHRETRAWQLGSTFGGTPPNMRSRFKSLSKTLHVPT